MVSDTRSERRLGRRLASDERSGRYARRRYREAYRAFLRGNWRWLLIGAGLLLAITAVVAICVRGELLRGIVIGFGVAGTVGALSQFVVVSSGAGPLMMGELAEQWTGREIRPLLQRGWHAINHFPLKRSDIDHLVLGTAGVFAIETKWSGLSWESEYAQRDVDRAVSQAERAAEELGNTEAYRVLHLPPPRALVVLWGPGAADLAEKLNRSDVLSGSELRDRMGRFGLVKQGLTVDQMKHAWRALSEHVTAQDRLEMAEPMPSSVAALLGTVIGGILSGLAAIFACASIVATGIPWWARLVAVVALAAAPHPFRRWPRIAPGVTGWQAGVAAALLLFAAAAGDDVLR